MCRDTMSDVSDAREPSMEQMSISTGMQPGVTRLLINKYNVQTWERKMSCCFPRVGSKMEAEICRDSSPQIRMWKHVVLMDFIQTHSTISKHAKVLNIKSVHMYAALSKCVDNNTNDKT